MRKGFTLIEILVVILIIGVLVAFALPQYELVIDQSRWSTLLPTAKAIKDAQERTFMQLGHYASEVDLLDVDMSENAQGDQITIGEGVYTLQNGDENFPDRNGIEGTHRLLPNNKVMVYLNNSANFSNDIHCLALTSNARAKRLCDNIALNELGEQGEYTVYLVEGNGTGELSNWPLISSCTVSTTEGCVKHTNKNGTFYETYTASNGVEVRRDYDENGQLTHVWNNRTDKEPPYEQDSYYENGVRYRVFVTYDDHTVENLYRDGSIYKQTQTYSDGVSVFNVEDGKAVDFSWYVNDNLKEYAKYDANGNYEYLVEYWSSSPGTVQFYNEYDQNGNYIAQTKYWPDGSVRGYYDTVDFTIATEYRKDGTCSRSEVYGEDGRAVLMYLYNTDGTYTLKPALYSETSNEGTPNPDPSTWSYGTYTTGQNGDIIRDDGVTIPGSGNFAPLCQAHPEQPQCAS